MRRVKLWLRKDMQRRNELEYYIRDIIDLDDIYQNYRFDGRTLSDDDKFEEGIFLTDDEFEKIIRIVIDLAREGILRAADADMLRYVSYQFNLLDDEIFAEIKKGNVMRSVEPFINNTSKSKYTIG